MLRIEYEAREQGITQTALSRASGIRRAAVNEIFHGWRKPKPREMKAIAAAVGWGGNVSALFNEIRLAEADVVLKGVSDEQVLEEPPGSWATGGRP